MTEVSSEMTGPQEVRRLLLLLIDSIASGGTSDAFGDTTPYLDSLTELRAMWFSDLYHFPKSLVELGILDREEAKIVEQFSNAFDRAYPDKSTPAEINIYKLQNDPTWLSVVTSARDAQAKLRQLKS